VDQRHSAARVWKNVVMMDKWDAEETLRLIEHRHAYPHGRNDVSSAAAVAGQRDANTTFESARHFGARRVQFTSNAPSSNG
jgi:hypothetical protein